MTEFYVNLEPQDEVGTNVFCKFDRGASGSLENSVERALSPYKIN